MHRNRDTPTSAGLTEVLARQELQELLGEDEMERLRARQQQQCAAEPREVSYAGEVLRQLEVDPMLDLNKVPEKLRGST